MSTVAVISNSSGFVNHATLAFAKNPNLLLHEADRGYEKNRMEKVGDLLSWHVVELPKIIYDAFQDPKVVTVALTALALISVQFAFYPITTAVAIKAVALFAAEHIPYWAAKFSIYLLAQSAVLGLGMRALGRFSNEDLMQKWYRT